MSWFAEFNPQIDWHNRSIELDLDDKQHTIIAAHSVDSFSDIELCASD